MDNTPLRARVGALSDDDLGRARAEGLAAVDELGPVRILLVSEPRRGRRQLINAWLEQEVLRTQGPPPAAGLRLAAGATWADDQGDATLPVTTAKGVLRGPATVLGDLEPWLAPHPHGSVNPFGERLAGVAIGVDAWVLVLDAVQALSRADRDVLEAACPVVGPPAAVVVMGGEKLAPDERAQMQARIEGGIARAGILAARTVGLGADPVAERAALPADLRESGGEERRRKERRLRAKGVVSTWRPNQAVAVAVSTLGPRPPGACALCGAGHGGGPCPVCGDAHLPLPRVEAGPPPLRVLVDLGIRNGALHLLGLRIARSRAVSEDGQVLDRVARVVRQLPQLDDPSLARGLGAVREAAEGAVASSRVFRSLKGVQIRACLRLGSSAEPGAALASHFDALVATEPT
jgi:hypothetical protein